MRDGIAACPAQGNSLYLPVSTTALAEAEAYAGEVDAASLTIETAIAETELEAETRRTHGEILLRPDPANTKSRRGSVREALATAQKEKAQVFERRAATRPGPALARSAKTEASPRHFCAGLRLVLGRHQHARAARSKGHCLAN
jgi:hypothetical protein